MKICEVAKLFNLLNEGISLSDLRKKIINGSADVSDKEKEWFDKDENKQSVIDTLNKVVGPNKRSEYQSLTNFNTNDYYKKGIVKAQSLRDAINMKIAQIDFRKENSSTKLSEEFEKINLVKNVDLFAVYTPRANTALSYKILKSSESPTWCIASPSSSSVMWNHYNLFEAHLPCVFIVVRYGNVHFKNKYKEYDVENLKYEIKCNPYVSDDFALGNIDIKAFVDEVRDANQMERTLAETSLFDNIKISISTLQKGMRALMNSDKAKSFSEKYGKKNFASIENFFELEGKTSPNRLNMLIKACYMGTVSKYLDYIKVNERLFILDRLMEFDNLTESDVTMFGYNENYFNRTIEYLIKEKRVTVTSLSNARAMFNYRTKEGRDVISRIIDAIDSSLASDRIFEFISFFEMPEKAERFFDELIQNDKLDVYALNRALEMNADEKLIDKIINYLCRNPKNYTSLLHICDTHEMTKKYVDVIIQLKLEEKTINYDILKFIYFETDKKYFDEAVKIALDNLEKIEGDVDEIFALFLSAKMEKEAMTVFKHIKEKGYMNENHLDIANNEKREDYINLISKEIIKRGNIWGHTIREILYMGREDIADVMIQELIKLNRCDVEAFRSVNDTYETDYPKQQKAMIRGMIKNDCLTPSLLYVISLFEDEELNAECVDYLIENEKINSDKDFRNLRHIGKEGDNNEVMRRAYIALEEAGKVDESILSALLYVTDVDDCIERCIDAIDYRKFEMNKKFDVWNISVENFPTFDLLKRFCDNLIKYDKIDGSNLTTIYNYNFEHEPEIVYHCITKMSEKKENIKVLTSFISSIMLLSKNDEDKEKKENLINHIVNMVIKNDIINFDFINNFIIFKMYSYVKNMMDYLKNNNKKKFNEFKKSLTPEVCHNLSIS